MEDCVWKAMVPLTQPSAYQAFMEADARFLTRTLTASDLATITSMLQKKGHKKMFSHYLPEYKRHIEAAGEFLTELLGVPSRVDNITIENEWYFGAEQRSRVTFDVASHGWVHGLAKNFRPKPTKVIRHDPATVVFMEDGTKHVIKCHDGDEYDPDLGILNIFLRKCLSNRRFDVYEKPMRRILKLARKAKDERKVKSVAEELRGIGNALLMAADAMEVADEA